MIDGLCEAADRSLFFGAQDDLELGKCLLDGVEVWTVGRKVKQPASGVFDCVTHASRFVWRQVVHDDDVARGQSWNENLLDIGLECYRVHCTVQDHGCGHSR